MPNFKRFKVVELLPQAIVRRVMVVAGSDAESVKLDPHGYNVVSSRYDIDEGGEAVTEQVETIKRTRRKR